MPDPTTIASPIALERENLMHSWSLKSWA